MALSVQYEEIRSEVIGKLDEQKGLMEDCLGTLTNIVNEIPTYMEGSTTDAYIAEFNDIVKVIYDKLNENLAAFSAQLESVCQEFESLDADMQSQLS